MATLLVFHLLGLYPVPSTSQLLILSPFTPKYTIHNSFLNVSTTVTVKGFDATSVQKTIPKGAAAYVANVTVNGATDPQATASAVTRGVGSAHDMSLRNVQTAIR